MTEPTDDTKADDQADFHFVCIPRGDHRQPQQHYVHLAMTRGEAINLVAELARAIASEKQDADQIDGPYLHGQLRISLDDGYHERPDVLAVNLETYE